MSMILCRMWIMTGGRYWEADLLLKRNVVYVINQSELLIQIVDINRTTTYCYCAKRIFCICQNWQTLLRRLSCPKSWRTIADGAQCRGLLLAADRTIEKLRCTERRENTWDRAYQIEIFLTGAIKKLYASQMIWIYRDVVIAMTLNNFTSDRQKGRKCEKSRQIVA